MMDEIDRKLLALLQEDATIPLAQLAERVGLSPTPCWKRVQKLEASGALDRTVAPHSVRVANGAASIPLTLPRQGVALVRLRW